MTMYLHILIIDSNLENAKKLKYSLQNKFINVYYTTKVLNGIKHLTYSMAMSMIFMP